MNGPEVLIPVAFFITVASIVRMVLQHREKRMDLEGRGGGLSFETHSRLERMEQAIDAMAVEIERVAETQRFTTRLLSERGALPMDAAPARDQISARHQG